MTADKNKVLQLNDYRADRLEDRSDDDLMLLARGGRKQAFALLVKRYQLQALKISMKYTGDIDKARDISQNTFIELYKYIPRYRAQGMFNRLFMRILMNQCHMAHRTEKKIDKISQALDTMPETESKLPDEVILKRETSREIQRALSKLSEKLRTVVVMRFSGEMSYNEIAEQLELPIGTVKSRLAAALGKLKETVQEENTP
jgi:RNA polymerase sigma-70 factor, ECF subfamily